MKRLLTFRVVPLICIYALFPSAACTKIEIAVERADSVELYQVEELPVISDENGWDIPANEGIRNALLNAEQIVNLRYTPIRELYRPGGSFDAGAKVRGMVYSSTRSEDLFCPNNVSFWTFLSSLKNPNSYLYTVDITESPYSIRGSARPIYGQVCSQFVQYALGIKYNIQIHQMTVWNGFDRVEPQDIQKLRLGDVLTTEKGHTRLVTGIRRENGEVVEIAISEGVSPTARRKIYPVNEIVDSFKDGYVFYRYRYINDTRHEPSPFVSVGDEAPTDYDELFVDEVMPRRGDKANWRKDEPVVIDVLLRGQFREYKLFKDEQLISRKEIPDNNVINLGVMPYGDYKLCLTNGIEDSRFVYWTVADYSMTAHPLGGGKVRVTFSSENATPIWTTWRIPKKSSSNYNNGPLWTTIITKDDAQKGFTVTELDSYLKRKFGLGRWDFKVAFETEYGIISSDSETVYVY